LKEHSDQFVNSDPEADKEGPSGYSQRDQEQDIPAAPSCLLAIIPPAAPLMPDVSALPKRLQR
jgi:hypothetical protein